MRHVIKLAAATTIVALTACTPTPAGPPEFTWTEQQSGVDLSMRGLAVVDAQTVWVGSPEGTVLRTVDGGDTWTHTQIAGAETLDLRSAHAFDDQHALFITAGAPARLYVTRDGGENFDLVLEDPSEAAFFDTLEFWDDQHGIAFSDPIDGAFHILLTNDGGVTWSLATGLPAPLDGEAGFAASDTSIAVAPGGAAWIGMGGAETARVLHTEDYGSSWTVHDTPMAAGSGGAGIFSLSWSQDRLVAVGGNYTEPDEPRLAAFWSDDRGQTWHIPATGTGGYRSAVTHIPGQVGYLLAVGTNGTDISADGGASWQPVSDAGFNAIRFADDGSVGWAVGSNGTISRIDVSGG